MKFRVTVDKARCKACELCVAVCPRSVLRMGRTLNSKGHHTAEVAHPDACIGCKACALICPDTAIEIDREVHDGADAGDKGARGNE